MNFKNLIATLMISSTLLLFGPLASAQVPPHQPGTICFAPTFWCWAEKPGPVGGICQCYSENTGWVWGTLG